ncbi:MAG: hypothetical protein EOO09_15195 [Chitinophagaceae bacterium]|nr:MAG: hypothetical protein EOO09_15195 [Chitinophagaceae bacterium]
MSKQSFKNHVKFYPAHHFLLLPLMTAAIVISTTRIFNDPEKREFYTWITIVLVFILWVAIMMRQHYALGNQNRIVRLEMRLRYYQLTGKRLELVEDRLSFGQIAALRFASDEQLPVLLEKAMLEGLTGKEIKKSILDWQPDHMRV